MVVDGDRDCMDLPVPGQCLKEWTEATTTIMAQKYSGATLRPLPKLNQTRTKLKFRCAMVDTLSSPGVLFYRHGQVASLPQDTSNSATSNSTSFTLLGSTSATAMSTDKLPFHDVAPWSLCLTKNRVCLSLQRLYALQRCDGTTYGLELRELQILKLLTVNDIFARLMCRKIPGRILPNIFQAS